MSSFNLTRIITLTPFYTITNLSSLELEFGEIGVDGSFPTNKWNYFSPSEVVFEGWVCQLSWLALNVVFFEIRAYF